VRVGDLDRVALEEALVDVVRKCCFSGEILQGVAASSMARRSVQRLEELIGV